jgi:hypothetical protein
MNEQFIKASWATKQPWRGLFVLVVTLLISFIITASFDIGKFTGFFGYFVMSCICMFVVIGPFWKGRCLPIEHIPQPLRGILLLVFAMLIGLLICYGLINFMGRGVLHPYVALHTIVSIITIFFLLLAFNFWPFDRLSLPAGGFLFIIAAYVIGLLLIQLFNFSVLSYPTGLNPSPIGAVPFYQEGGPFANFIAPFGPFLWEHAITYSICAVAFLWCFAMLSMWPFSKLKIQQPLFGAIVTIVCLILGYIAFIIAVDLLKIEPLTFMCYAISLVFGILLIMTIFQMWPGRALGPVAGGFVNLALSVVLAIIGYYGIRAFCLWHFGEAMMYPDDLFAINTMMLGLLFPMWAVYGDLFNFWPLPPLPQSEEKQQREL